MSDEFDDDILNTEDSYSESDFDEQDFTPASEGEHEVLVEEVRGEMHDFAEYTGPRARLTMNVCDEKDMDYGRKIFDNINLPHPDEKPGNRKRRAAILAKLGKVSKGTSGDVKFNWKLLEGMRLVVDCEHSTGKNGKTYCNPKFAGYRLVGSAVAGESTSSESKAEADNFDDI